MLFCFTIAKLLHFTPKCNSCTEVVGHLYGSSIQTQIVMIVMIVMKVIKKKSGCQTLYSNIKILIFILL